MHMLYIILLILDALWLACWISICLGGLFPIFFSCLGGSSVWAITPEERGKYDKQFDSLAPVLCYVSGTLLPQQTSGIKKNAWCGE